MIDPYQVLGVSRDAADEEIKKAYRKLSRQYHPDANINNPNKDMAEEKFKEIQQAYKNIMDSRNNHAQGGYGGTYYKDGFKTQSGANYQDSHLTAAANYIRNGYYNEALNVLEAMSDRSSQWYYLSAIANSGIGSQATAMEYAQRAAAMEPQNMDYQRLLIQLQNGGAWYTSRGNDYGMSDLTNGDLCWKLCIANMVCNICCGGGGVCFGGRSY